MGKYKDQEDVKKENGKKPDDYDPRANIDDYNPNKAKENHLPYDDSRTLLVNEDPRTGAFWEIPPPHSGVPKEYDMPIDWDKRILMEHLAPCETDLESVADYLLAQRKEDHGCFERNANLTYEMIDAFIKDTEEELSSSMNMAVYMILYKLARIAQRPNNEDHWRDIAGYATLIKNQLIKQQKEEKDG